LFPFSFGPLPCYFGPDFQPKLTRNLDFGPCRSSLGYLRRQLCTPNSVGLYLTTCISRLHRSRVMMLARNPSSSRFHAGCAYSRTHCRPAQPARRANVLVAASREGTSACTLHQDAARIASLMSALPLSSSRYNVWSLSRLLKLGGQRSRSPELVFSVRLEDTFTLLLLKTVFRVLVANSQKQANSSGPNGTTP